MVVQRFSPHCPRRHPLGYFARCSSVVASDLCGEPHHAQECSELSLLKTCNAKIIYGKENFIMIEIFEVVPVDKIY